MVSVGFAVGKISHKFIIGEIMGYTFEIYDYYRDVTKSSERSDHLVYETNSLIYAFWMFFKTKRTSSCTTMIWR